MFGRAKTLIVEMAANTITVDKLLSAMVKSDDKDAGKTIEVKIFKFPKREILKMPKRFRKKFRTASCTVHVLKRTVLQHNPMDMIFHTKHQREHGKALSKNEEIKLMAQTAGTPYQLMFAIGLYTGMLPNEYKTAKIEGEFIVKRKNGKVELKRIPINPMLKPYLENVKDLSFVRLEAMRIKLKEILPNHKLYDLRTTFCTRCTECGVAELL